MDLAKIDVSNGQVRRFEAVDSLRGVCASMIVLLHLSTNGYIANAAMIRHASLFVDFFFVLSGFVIAASYGDRLAQGFPVRKFMALRMGRIMPLHFAMLALFILFELALAAGFLGKADRTAFTGTMDLRWLVTSALLVQIFVGPDALVWNGPSWSIAAEMWTYLIFAGLYRRARPLIVLISITIATATCIYLAHLTDRYLAVYHDGALARCLFGFACGTLSYRLVTRMPRLTVSAWSATPLEMAAVALVVVLVSVTGPTPLSLVMPGVFLLVVALFSQQKGQISRLLLTGPFRLLGRLSYSIYMVHEFLLLRLVNVLTLFDRLTHHRYDLVVHNAGGGYRVGGSALFGDAMSLFLLALAIAAAAITYSLIERPGQRWSRHIVLGDHPRPATRSAEANAPTF